MKETAMQQVLGQGPDQPPAQKSADEMDHTDLIGSNTHRNKPPNNGQPKKWEWSTRACVRNRRSSLDRTSEVILVWPAST